MASNSSRPELPHPDRGARCDRRREWTICSPKTPATSTSTRPSCSTRTGPGVLRTNGISTYFRNGAPQFVATLDTGHPGHADADLARRLTRRDPDLLEPDVVRQQGFPGDLHLQPGHRSDPVCVVQPDRRAADRRTPKRARTGASWPTTAGRSSRRPDSLVPRDKDGTITDVYEYVDGRPQLITTGQANRDFTGGSEVFSLSRRSAYTGLEAVSHDGADVYFSTFETLVKRDHNGEYVKFYDARTGGGFAEEPAALPCAAADECHGAGQLPAGSAARSPAPATSAAPGTSAQPRNSKGDKTRSRNGKEAAIEEAAP